MCVQRFKTKKLSHLKTNFMSMHGADTSICGNESMGRETDDPVEPFSSRRRARKIVYEFCASSIYIMCLFFVYRILTIVASFSCYFRSSHQ